MNHTLRGDGSIDASIDRLPMMARWLAVAFVAMAAVSAPAAAQAPLPVAGGLRWIGVSARCMAPPGWGAERVLRCSPPGTPPLCLYTWLSGADPTQGDLNTLFLRSGATQLTEDVPVVFPSAFPSEQAVIDGLRNALQTQVGTAALLPKPPVTPAVRIAVIDSAPDAAAGQIVPGASRHGDTLAHLIEDIVCANGPEGRRCAVEVTTTLALPLIPTGVDGSRGRYAVGPQGGFAGTLTQLAQAIDRAVMNWQTDLKSKPDVPPRLVLNLSLGWEDTRGIADCADDTLLTSNPPALAVRTALQNAVAQGALVIAAAGNNSFGPSPRTGLVCPGRYQAVAKDSDPDPSQSLVIAVSGVDYRDRPLLASRPAGITGISALGLGGVAWRPGDPVPPPLTGTSVSTAVVSAIAALVWTVQPSFRIPDVVSAIYGGGIDVGDADECPLGISPCRSHRASVCGALRDALGPASLIDCAPPAALPSSSPPLPQVQTLLAEVDQSPALQARGRSTTTQAPSTLPNKFISTVQVEPEVFPEPISSYCPVCAVAGATAGAAFVIPRLNEDLDSAVLVILDADGNEVQQLGLGMLVSSGAPYVYSLSLSLPPPLGKIWQSAYLTGIGGQGFSVTEQIPVQW
jgi:hypothetical protein